MQVRDLDEQLVPGYRTLNVIGLTPVRRACCIIGSLAARPLIL